jgi:hypothetical protein
MESDAGGLHSTQPAYSMVKVIKYLDELGFKMNPVIKDGTLFCSNTEETFLPEEISLVGSFRFEGSSDPEDLSIVYALQADNGARAVLVDAYGPYSDPELSDFITLIRDERENYPIMTSIPPHHTILISSKYN